MRIPVPVHQRVPAFLVSSSIFLAATAAPRINAVLLLLLLRPRAPQQTTFRRGLHLRSERGGRASDVRGLVLVRLVWP
ncbi:hypothetical protein B0H11DRAFT_2078943 [Mycena galericulata]|nr:hypothetical protein B0H11DRAFT_2078943 [Mycena galericulata]